MDKKEIINKVIEETAKGIYDIISKRESRRATLKGTNRRLVSHPSDQLPKDLYAIKIEVGRVLDKSSNLSRSVRDFIKSGVRVGTLKVMQDMAAEEDEKMFAERLNDPFYVDNGKKNGVVTLESGVQIEKVVSNNKRKSPTDTDEVKVAYKLALTSKPEDILEENTAEFKMSEVIPGFRQALATMHVGEKARVVIPPKHGYGGMKTDKIPPYSILMFDVELLDFEPEQDKKE